MKNNKVLGIILVLIFSVALNGYNFGGGNKNRPSPTRPKAQNNQSGNKSNKPMSSPGGQQGNNENKLPWETTGKNPTK